MSDNIYETFRLLGEPRSRPWWDPLAPYLYRPHQNVNQYVAQGNIMLEIAKYPATEFENAKEALLVRAHALEPGLIARMVLSPIGPTYFGQGGHDSSDYFRRAHGHAGLQTLVRLQVRLRATGITRPEDVARALAGPLGQAHPDPFTGKSVRFDRGQSTLSFEAQAKHLTGSARNLLKNTAKVELPL